MRVLLLSGLFAGAVAQVQLTSSGLLRYADGFVCDDYFDADDGRVACRELGGTYEGHQIAQNTEIHGHADSFSVDDLECAGTESTLRSCQGRFDGHNCSSREGVRLNCGQTYGVSLTSTGILRFGDGFVCDDSFDEADGRVACREMGATYVSHQTSVQVETNNFTADDLACTGNELHIAACTGSRFGGHNCGTSEGVRLTCGARQAISLDSGGILRYGDGYVCDDSFDTADATVVCRELGQEYVSHSTSQYTGGSTNFTADDLACSGHESSISSCSGSFSDHNCGSSEGVSVVCGDANVASLTTTGLLRYGNGFVCDDSFDSNDGAVACREMGGEYFAHFTARTLPNANFSADDMSCSGGESRLAQCSFTSSHNCYHGEGVRLVCHTNGTPWLPDGMDWRRRLGADRLAELEKVMADPATSDEEQ